MVISLDELGKLRPTHNTGEGIFNRGVCIDLMISGVYDATDYKLQICLSFGTSISLLINNHYKEAPVQQDTPV